jgi:LPXTG-site transpeptidase (sortase) family protein
MPRVALIISALLMVGLLSAEVEPGEAAVARASGMTPWLSVPRLHLNVPVKRNQDEGPAWWPDVPTRPGGGSTIAIAGHRTTHGGPFRRINELERGDIIKLRWRGTWHRYQVTGSRVFPVSELHIADLRPNEWLILTSCTQPNRQPTSASYRLAVYARPAETQAVTADG